MFGDYRDLIKTVDIPSINLVTNGIEMNSQYNNVPNAYLGGIINFMTPYMIVLIQSHLSEAQWQELRESNIIKRMGENRADYRYLPDDSVIFLETDCSYWGFHLRYGYVTSTIIRMNKDDISKYQFVTEFKNANVINVNSMHLPRPVDESWLLI